jgi:hypothetical protein
VTIRSGVYVPNYGTFGDVRKLAGLCHEAEQAGWDGFFVWDTIYPGVEPVVDPWVVLSACAATTSHIMLGAMVTAVARRRPMKLARELLSLDQLSGGRVIGGVGLGDSGELRVLGEPSSVGIRRSRFEDGTRRLAQLLQQRPSSSSSSSLTEPVELGPRPTHGRIRLWLGMSHDRPQGAYRAATLPVDGIIPMRRPWDLGRLLDRDGLNGVIRAVRDAGARLEDVATIGRRANPECQPIEGYVETEMTWWLEILHPDVDSDRDVHSRIRSGPPRW